MAKFEVGETVICAIEIRDDAGNYKDPATSTTITIINPAGTVVVNNAAMTKDAVGKYHYDYNSGATALGGTYTTQYTATDGTRITIETETFELQ